MATKARLDTLPGQSKTNAIWDAVWENAISLSDPGRVLEDKNFKKIYPVIRAHIPGDARNILEVGSGSGRFGVMLGKDFPSAQVEITDILDSALAVGRSLAEYMKVGNVSFAREDIFHLSYPDECFDVVICNEVLPYVPNRQNALREVLRVLKPGGMLVVSSKNSWNPLRSIYRGYLRLTGDLSQESFEEAFSLPELRRFLRRHLMYVVSGVSAWNTLSRYFGAEIFLAAKKHVMKVRHSGYVRLPSFEDTKEGMLMAVEFAKALPFEPKRVYVLSNVNDYHTVRGGHAHRALDQVIFCLAGSFELRLDDGKTYQKIMMRSNGYGIRLKPMLWHSMRKFSRDCVILVFASAPYDESDYIRDHAEFLRLATSSAPL